MVVLRAATRSSPLALWQANWVADALTAAHPDLTVELVTVDTEGDRRLDVPISTFGGKGVFAKEVQAAVLEGRADFAVHSAKDLPALTLDGLVLAAVPERADPRDALVGVRLHDLAPGAVIATGSQRRRAQLRQIRPDLEFVELRGNMASRLAKIPDGGSIVVAAAALQRLGLDHRLTEILEVSDMIPQVAQGALAVECRSDDPGTQAALRQIEHPDARRRVDAERAFLVELGGDCDLPAGAHATLDASSGAISLVGFLASSDGAGARRARRTVTGTDPAALGTELARSLRLEIDGTGGSSDASAP